MKVAVKESTMAGARRLAFEAMREARRALAFRRRADVEPRSRPGLFTCPECGRVNLKAHPADAGGERPIFAHRAVSVDAGLGNCVGGRAPGILQA